MSSTPLSWETSPAAMPALAVGDVALWSFDLDRMEDGFESLLSREELARAARLLRPEHRRRFRAAHAALRLVLARHTGAAPEDLAFAIEAQGRPILDPPSDIAFSLSHSGRYGLAAVTIGCAVGVDVEGSCELAEAVALARNNFTLDETNAIAAAASPSAAFLAHWTLKEAVVKATGEGLARPLDSFSIRLQPDGGAELAGLAGDTRPWTLRSFVPEPGTIAGLALGGALTRLRCCRITPHDG